MDDGGATAGKSVAAAVGGRSAIGPSAMSRTVRDVLHWSATVRRRPVRGMGYPPGASPGAVAVVSASVRAGADIAGVDTEGEGNGQGPQEDGPGLCGPAEDGREE